MRQPRVFALAAAFLLGLPAAQAASFDQGLHTLWETLWHQAGTATRLVRWEQELRVRVHGVHADAHRAATLQALRAAGDAAGLRVTDVSDRPDAARVANVQVEITPDSALSEDQPCETRLDFRTETTIDAATLQMREGDAARCALHEAMHVMGVRGHPAGETVLSYFAPPAQALQPLDRVLLRAWYSPRARGGMTPFEILPILADEWVALQPDPAAARVARDRFLARTVAEMEAFAGGAGDVPAIVRQSGKSTPGGIRFGRREMSEFLGVAYQQGASVAPDARAADRWLRHAGAQGSTTAQARLGLATAGAR